VSSHERKVRRLRRQLATGGALGALLAIAGAAAPNGAAAEILTAAGWLLMALIGMFLVIGVSVGSTMLKLYPDLGARKRLWVQAGATPAQLSTLNEIHRLQRLNPPAGYGDRRTMINPLADAYAIFSSRAWRDPWLADRQLLIDPIAEAADIVDYVHRVTQMLAEINAKKVAASPGSATRAQYEMYQNALRQSLDVALRRAKALTQYRREVEKLERLLDDQRSWPAAAALGDRVMDVLSESARHDLATSQLRESSAQLRLIESGLREITLVLNETALELPR
jgi:hypothetical protein